MSAAIAWWRGVAWRTRRAGVGTALIALGRRVVNDLPETCQDIAAAAKTNWKFSAFIFLEGWYTYSC
jgi:hypothetical protein